MPALVAASILQFRGGIACHSGRRFSAWKQPAKRPMPTTEQEAAAALRRTK